MTPRLAFLWVTAGLVLAMGADWLLTLAWIPRLEAGYLLFALGFGWSAAWDGVARWIGRTFG